MSIFDSKHCFAPLGDIRLVFFLHFRPLYSLSDVSSAAKLTPVLLRPHCTDESLYRDRPAGQQPSRAGAFSSLPLATISAPQIHRSPLGSDSCPLPLLPSRFSMKNDDAFDEVGAWFPDTFSSIFSQTHGVSTPNPSGSCLDCALQPPKSPIIILSAAACALENALLLHGRDGTRVFSVSRRQL